MERNIFIILYSTDDKPYSKYKEVDNSLRSITVPRALVLSRWDGKLGFTGGEYEGDPIKSLEKALLEKTGWVSAGMLNGMELILKTENDTSITETYALKLSNRMLESVSKKILTSKCYLSEVTGSMLAPLKNYGNNEYDNFLENNFAYTAKEELEGLVKVLTEREEL